MQGPASVAGVAAVTGVAAAAAAGDAATDTVTAPGPADTDDAVADTHPHGVMGHPMVDTPTAGAANASPAPTMPSAEWVADGRPQLSPEHVALLTWWAQMIESGQIPAPPGSDEAPTGNVEPPRRRFPKRAAAIAVVLVAVVALAAALVPRMLAGGEDSAGLPATDVSLPATVGELTAITEPGIGDELEPILNFGLRPAGVTVTAAYGPETAGPLTFAALGTSVAAPADARGLITAWAERTGATMGEPVVGDGPTLGVTCASATASPSVPDGTFCVWASTTARGEAFGIDMSTDQAAGLTAELRDTTTTSAVG